MDGLLRFYCVSIGRYDDYQEIFILATSPNDAAKRFMRSQLRTHTESAMVSNGDFNDHGALRRGDDIYNVEVPGERGYLWDSEQLLKMYPNRVVCRLCGDMPSEEEPKDAFLNAERKCKICADLKKIEL